MFSVGTLCTALETTLASAGGAVEATQRRLCVALSGGLDSTVLLAALAQVQRAASSGQGFPLRALHVDHGLHPDSPAWSAHCARLAAAHGIAFEAITLHWQPARGASVEAAART